MTDNREREDFVVMVKPVGSLCNLRCTYCYYIEKNTNAHDGQSFVMSDETLENFIKNYFSSSKGPVVSFTWHGGEPSLAGLSFFKKAAALQKKYCLEGFSVWNSLQTNGTLLDDEWCDFLKAEHFDVGLSIDGNAWIHDKYRLGADGGRTYDKALAAAKNLKAHGVLPDLLCTVTKDSTEDPIAVYNALKNLNTGWIQFLPIVVKTENGVTPESVTPFEYGNFLCKIFDYWMQNDIGVCDVQLFSEAAAVLSGGSPTLCTMAKTCGRALIVEREGDIYSCDHFVDSAHLLGNVNRDALSQLVKTKFQKSFADIKDKEKPKACESCEFLRLCGGGCPKDRFHENGETSYYLCEGLKRFYSHALPFMKIIRELHSAGKTPSFIMEEMRKLQREKWKDIGRNDMCPCGSGKKAKNCCWSIKP